jgi:hypothetical protein
MKGGPYSIGRFLGGAMGWWLSEDMYFADRSMDVRPATSEESALMDKAVTRSAAEADLVRLRELMRIADEAIEAPKGERNMEEKIITARYDQDLDEYVGTYEGPVTREDIVAKLGQGSWGHRFQNFGDGVFVYIKLAE